MKSKRVTKLLACVLAASMCAVPVAAASETMTITDDKAHDMDVDFGVNSPIIDVTVPTKANVKVNPMYDKNGTAGDLKEFAVASKELVISNNTSSNDDGSGVALLCTVRGTITNVGEGVGVSYNTFTPKPASEKKLIHLDITSSNTLPAVSENNKFKIGTAPCVQVPMTNVGARLQLPIAASSNVAGTNKPGYGAFAITGVANVAADWADTDVNVSLSYRVRAIQESPMNNPSIANAPATTSGNIATAATVIATKTDLAAASLGDGVTVTGLIIHNPENEFDDYALTAEDLEINTDATGCEVKIKAGDPGLTFLGSSYKGKGQDLLLGLSDGRIIATTITVN